MIVAMYDRMMMALQAGRAGKRKWDQPAPTATAAGSNVAAVGAQPPLPAAQQAPPSPPLPAPYPPQQSNPQPLYQDPQMQQPGYSQPYQQHPGSMGMQGMQSMAPSSFGMPIATMGAPGAAPWQTQAVQQQPWGMGGQAPGYGQYPPPGMGSMSHQMPGKPGWASVVQCLGA